MMASIMSVILPLIVMSGVIGKSLSKQQTVLILPESDKDPQPSPWTSNPGDHCRAVVQTSESNKYLGASGAISLYKPQVTEKQWSSSRVKLLNGPESIEAGWMVNPDLFEDHETHLYTKFTTDKIGSNGCINNIQCDGFVQEVSTEVPLGAIPNEYSMVDGKQYFWTIYIEKQSKDENWSLSVGTAGSTDKKLVGHWPKNLFTSLGEFADRVEWGGEINNPGRAYPPPQMGNGKLADYVTKSSGHFRRVTVIDEGNKIVVNPPNTSKILDCSEKLYTVLDGGYQGDDLGRVIFYGGGLV